MTDDDLNVWVENTFTKRAWAASNQIFEMLKDAVPAEKDLLLNLAHASGTHAEVTQALAERGWNKQGQIRHAQAAEACLVAAKAHRRAQTTA